MSEELGWREAAVAVLKDRAEAMHYTAIADEILRLGLKTKVGATPAGSVNVAITDSMRYDTPSPFDRTARGYYRLRVPEHGTESVGHAEAPNVPEGSAQVVPPSSTPDQIEPEAELQEPTGLINALGMYWSRERVDWRRPAPKLLGTQTTGSDPVDFYQQKGVYLLYDRNEVIYVGRASEQGIGARLKEHTVDRLAGRWDRFSWFGVNKVTTEGKLDDAQGVYDRSMLIATMEALLIESVEPRQNRKRGDDFAAIEFSQADDPDLARAKTKETLMGLLNHL
jgi:hypothetical protein